MVKANRSRLFANQKILSVVKMSTDQLSVVLEDIQRTNKHSRDLCEKTNQNNDDLKILGGKLESVTKLLQVIITKAPLAERVELLIYCKLLQNCFENIDQGRRFSEEDEHCPKVAPTKQIKRWSMGYSKVSFDELTNTNREINCFSKQFRKKTRCIVDAYQNIYNQIYQVFSGIIKMSNNVKPDDFDSVIMPPIANKFPTLPPWFTKKHWNTFIDCILGLKVDLEKLKQPTKTIQIETPNPPKETTAIPFKKRKHIPESSYDDDAINEYYAAESRRSGRNDKPESDEDAPLDNDKKQLYHSLKQKVNLGGNMVDKAISLKSYRARDYNIDYPGEAVGTGKCHFRAFYAIGGETLLQKGIEDNIKYKDVDRVKELVKNHGSNDCQVFRMYKSDHWIALTAQFIIDDDRVYHVNNYGLAYYHLMFQDGKDATGERIVYPDILSKLPKLLARHKKNRLYNFPNHV